MSVGRRYLTFNEKALVDLSIAFSVYDINKDTVENYIKAARRLPGLSSMNMQILAGAFMYLQYSGAFSQGFSQQFIFDFNVWSLISKNILPSIVTEKNKAKVVPSTQTAMLRYIRQILSSRAS